MYKYSVHKNEKITNALSEIRQFERLISHQTGTYRLKQAHWFQPHSPEASSHTSLRAPWTHLPSALFQSSVAALYNWIKVSQKTNETSNNRLVVPDQASWTVSIYIINGTKPLANIMFISRRRRRTESCSEADMLSLYRPTNSVVNVVGQKSVG